MKKLLLKIMLTAFILSTGITGVLYLFSDMTFSQFIGVSFIGFFIYGILMPFGLYVLER